MEGTSDKAERSRKFRRTRLFREPDFINSGRSFSAAEKSSTFRSSSMFAAGNTRTVESRAMFPKARLKSRFPQAAMSPINSGKKRSSQLNSRFIGRIKQLRRGSRVFKTKYYEKLPVGETVLVEFTSERGGRNRVCLRDEYVQRKSRGQRKLKFRQKQSGKKKKKTNEKIKIILALMALIVGLGGAFFIIIKPRRSAHADGQNYGWTKTVFRRLRLKSKRDTK